MSQLTSEQINYQFLLLTHMVCADEQIHIEEAKALRQLAHNTNMGTYTIEEMEKILSQDENFISVENVARQIQLLKQSEAMRQMIAIAYIDGYFSPLERDMVDHVAKIWNWPNSEIERLLEQTEKLNTIQFDSYNRDKSELSVGARLLKGIDSVLSRALVDNLAKAAPENIGNKIGKLRKEILLVGPEYDDAIQRCTIIANEDYKYAENSLQSAYSALAGLAKNLDKYTEEIDQRRNTKGKVNNAEEVAKQLESTKNELTVKTLKELERVRESLRAKQRALKHFSIAFIGKTKAGKSTLHAIITGDGWDAIGVGKQRTTRFNRVYEWKNIRIIDTPGIGAPSGKSDEEIAESIIEESDVICYVVTDDSIQSTEFKFLQILKEKVKPLIILLNIKKNLRDTRRLENFLKDSGKLFVMNSTNCLNGHIERIRHYANQHYANDYFDIIPVMLLAAQMSREIEHQEYKDELFKASRMQDFLDAIRVSLVEHGVIRRSQTLLGSTVGAIEEPNKWVTEQLETYQKLTYNLKNMRDKFQEGITKASRDNHEYLIQQIKTVFKDVFDTIQPFAEENWDADENQLKLKWENRLTILKFQDRLNNAFEKNGKKFNHEVEELLEEIGTEFQLIARLGGENFNFNKQSSIKFKDMLRIGVTIVGFATSITMLFAAPPLGIIMTIGTVISAITTFLKSQKEKQREAAAKISQSLNNQLQIYQQKTLEKAKEEFSGYCDTIAANINNYFDELIQSIEKLSKQLAKAKSQLDSSANYLNRAYAKRIIDWCIDKYEVLTDENIIKNIGKVERDFGRSIKIRTKFELKFKKNQETINRVLQEDVYIILPEISIK
ncbi:GTPase [Nostoc sp. ATCC 53789]|uniref:GTPase n=1 Tax=Nostoc sp. ATCC 53789 TaxID=76335 RepID=UPI000DEC7888|nr:GTPase [Nostoc sp. ATCC 53789]QHG18958.1 GTPase [Nostoc sp. ATCC 53789]RCJ17582.1 GTPase [Nostoc sp. ATCC 53789]